MRYLVSKLLIVLVALVVAGFGLCSDDPQQSTVSMQATSAADLEKAGDHCRAQKDYTQAIKYFDEAIRKDPKNAKLYNKLGLAELANGDYKAARYDFEKATRYNRAYPEAWNDLGVIAYVEHNYKAAANYFKKAIALDETRASFHVNLGVTWFTRNEMDRAMREYSRALELDPEALTRSSTSGVTAQITNRAERAKHDYMMARIYARMGNVDNCLVCLRKAKENGYADLSNVYKDEEFARVRQDTRLAEIVPPPPVK